MVKPIVATGLVNGAFLVLVAHIRDLATTLHGQLLLAKQALFEGMPGLAVVNRFRLTPARAATPRLKHSLAVETGLALLILALIARLGMLARPIAAAGRTLLTLT